MNPKIDVLSCIARKNYSGELAFEFEMVDLLDIPYVEFSSPVKAAVHYEIFEDNKVEVQLRLTFTLKGACSRCMNAAEETFEEPAEGIFEFGQGDGETYGYTNYIDLTEFLRDSLAFALPLRLLCPACKSCDGENE